LEYLEKHDLPKRAALLGARLLGGLERLATRPQVIDTRGIGLLAAVEFASPSACARFVDKCLAKGLIVNWTLHRDTVVRMAPPLVISARALDRATDTMESALHEI